MLITSLRQNWWCTIGWLIEHNKEKKRKEKRKGTTASQRRDGATFRHVSGDVHRTQDVGSSLLSPGLGFAFCWRPVPQLYCMESLPKWKNLIILPFTSLFLGLCLSLAPFFLPFKDPFFFPRLTFLPNLNLNLSILSENIEIVSINHLPTPL